MVEEKTEEEKLRKIDLSQFRTEPEAEEPVEAKEPEEGEEEEKEPGYFEVSLSSQMLIALVGFAISTKYYPDKTAMKAFNEKYRKELPEIVEDFGLTEVFNEILGATLSFKIQKSELMEIPLPGWAGLAGVVGLLVAAGFIIKVPSTKDKTKLHKDIQEGKERGLTKEPRKEAKKDES